MAKKKQALGRGLSALLENASTDITSRDRQPVLAGTINSIEIAAIETNPFQPRTEFDENALQELSNSIKEHGIIQPITVRKMGYGKFQLISGERRFRASQLAGLDEIPAYVRVADDKAMLEMALVENLQRDNLNPIEVALSFKRLLEECDLTQEELGERVSKKRSTVSNFLRLLKLPVEIQLSLGQGKLSMGHAKALLAVESTAHQTKIHNKIIEGELSVRQTEALIKTFNEDKKSIVLPKAIKFDQQEIQLATFLNQKVKIKSNENGIGQVLISFKNEDELANIIKKIKA